MEKILSLCKRRGFVFGASEIYGGIQGIYDFGPLGIELKNNIKRLWWKKIVQERDDVVGLDSAIIQNPNVWKASGHLERFYDLLTECKSCHKRFRVDHLLEELNIWEPLNKNIDKLVEEMKCPECGGTFTPSRKFNLMLKTFVGPLEDESTITYLRPETAQGIFTNFKNVLDTQRKKIPFGIAQIGKSFRNEITPKNFLFRTREFEQMELEFFVKPGEDEIWFDYWIKERMKWYVEILGIRKENLRIRFHTKEELAHYAKSSADIEYKFPFGWGEIEGIANRTDFDLKQHQRLSLKNLEYYDEKDKKSYIPYVIEPSCGVERIFLALLFDAYEEVKGGRTKTTQSKKETEIVLKFNRQLAPIKVAILPLVKNKEDLVKKARDVYEILRKHFVCQYDEVGSIGRRYRRQDEIGTPYCITIDFDTLKDNTATIRDRDTMEQERVKIEDLVKILQEKIIND